jgi:alkylation response protein AidB-like acyl-CoA dehydrogenase
VDGQSLERARAIADGLLWPNVAATDAAEAVPAGHLDALADAGLYGLGAPAALGGLEADPGTVCAAIELLAGADLTTTFVWAQHLGAIQALARSPDDQLRRSWLPRLCGGQLRAGREAAFLLVTGSRPAIKTALLDRLGATNG